MTTADIIRLIKNKHAEFLLKRESFKKEGCTYFAMTCRAEGLEIVLNEIEKKLEKGE